MSKKLINSPDSCVEDLIHGLLYANPMLSQVQGCNALVHSSIESLREEQVTLISGIERSFSSKQLRNEIDISFLYRRRIRSRARTCRLYRQWLYPWCRSRTCVCFAVGSINLQHHSSGCWIEGRHSRGEELYRRSSELWNGAGES